MTAVLIAGGRVVDPANARDGPCDVLIERGVIAEVRPGVPPNGAKVVEAHGKLVMPGAVDLHTHLREPGREDQETIESGLTAAVRGGFTTVCPMPNTEPALDSRGAVERVRHAAKPLGLAAVAPIGAVTKGRAGKELSDFGELFEAGCVALSDDGRPVADALLMRRALEYAKMFERPIIQHAEDLTLSAGGVMHEGVVSTTLGLRGMPGEAESVMVARDLLLAELTGGWLHVAHLSSARSVELIRLAKRRGVRVTCEVTPHHLSLTHEAVGTFDTRAKVNPPLRAEEDRMSLIEGVRDGTIDCIATDHAPHSDWEKDAEFDAAPFGIAGLETALAVCVTALVVPGHLPLSRLIEALTAAPARIAGVTAGTLSVGAQADVVILDPAAQWTVDPRQFASNAKHSPFDGWTLTGKVEHVFVRGVHVQWPSGPVAQWPSGQCQNRAGGWE